MDLEGVSLPLFHEHLMVPWNDLRRGDCCGRLEAISDGYYCKACKIFFHKKCVDESPQYIQHPSHTLHTLDLQKKEKYSCDLCGMYGMDISYRCDICDFDVDILCAKYPPPEIIDISQMHHHKLTLLKEEIEFHCDANCGTDNEGFPYKCQECDVSFHVDCVWNLAEAKHPSEVNHPYHPLHPLKLYTGERPDYFDPTCSLCEREIDDKFFYHCSACKFSLDMGCVLNPPSQYVLNLKAHDHQLTLLTRVDSFTCNACGLKGNRSPYVCLPCGFMIHQRCIQLPRLININRHDHRISRTPVLGIVNSVCGVCRQKVEWNWGGFICKRCPQYVVHSKCAIRFDVWNQKELEGVPEEAEDIEPYVVIDDNTILHFSHEEHHLKFHANGLLWEENKRCSACTHPICLQPFYGCIICNFFLHKKCAESPKKKWHVLHNEKLTLVTSVAEAFQCKGCNRFSNGFKYKRGNIELDVRCGAISEPFIHPCHPQHPFYYHPDNEIKCIFQCNGCGRNKWKENVLTCIESGCEFFLCFHCATLPQVVKHRVDEYPLSLCYGEEATGKFWCDICELETNPKKWFYTCKDHQASLHIRCVLGDFSGFMPRSTTKFYGRPHEVVLNNSNSRPFCIGCKKRCMYPINLKVSGTSYHICSIPCAFGLYQRTLGRR